jgi:Zn-dependent membrane protease YugP
MTQQTEKTPVRIRFLLFFANVLIPLALLIFSVALACAGFLAGSRNLMFLGAVLCISAVGFMGVTFVLTADALMRTVGQYLQETTGGTPKDTQNSNFAVASILRH